MTDEEIIREMREEVEAQGRGNLWTKHVETCISDAIANGEDLDDAASEAMYWESPHGRREAYEINNI